MRACWPLVELCDAERFVLVYVTARGLYDLGNRDEVQIKAGFQSAWGVITRIELVAASLPRKFQRTFDPCVNCAGRDAAVTLQNGAVALSQLRAELVRPNAR